MAGINGAQLQQAASWNYSIPAGDISLAYYPGNVQVDGLIYSNVAAFSSVAAVGFSDIPDNVTSVNTAGYYSAGDGGGATYVVAGGAGPGHIQSGDGRFWKPQLSLVYNIRCFGARGDGVAIDVGAINDAIAFAGTNGGGIVFMPSGNFKIDNSNPGAVHWDNRRAIYIPYSNVSLLGAGRGACKISLADGADAHIIAVGNRGTAGDPVITCSYVNVADFEIDGNRLNQTLPSELVDHWAGVYVVNSETSGQTCTGVTVERLYAHDIQYYAIGFQRNAFVGCAIRDIVSDRTGADGVDCKGDDDLASFGNVIENVVCTQWGLAPALVNQAGVDLRNGWTGRAISVKEPGPAGLTGIRLQNGVPGVTPRDPTSITGWTSVGSAAVGSTGFRAIEPYGMSSEGVSRSWADGVSATDPDGRLSSIVSSDNTQAGFRFWQNAVSGAEADTGALVGLVGRNNGTGAIVDSCDELTFIGCDFRNNNVGYDIRAGSTGIRIIGGSCVGNTTNLINNGSSTIIQYVSGLRTASKVSKAFDIASIGLKTVVITHGLAVTPNASDVVPVVRKGTAVTDARWNTLEVISTDAVNVTIELQVTVASATPGATAIMCANVNALSA